MDNFRDSYFQVDWDLTTKRLKGTFWGKQYDTGRGFTVTVINGGQVVTATNEVLRLKWEKSDNTTGYVNATIVNGKFIVENIDQMFTVHGAVRADFELSVAGESLASITFYVSVEKAVAVDAIESSSQFTALQEALAAVDDVQGQVDAVIANATVDSEVILARGTRPTLGVRLDADKAETDQRIDAIIATPIDLPEIYVDEIHDARQGKGSIGANITEVKASLAETSRKIVDESKRSVNPRGKNQKTSLVTFVTDDGSLQDILTMLPIFTRQQVPFCTAPVATRVLDGLSGYCTIPQLKSLEDAGHEIMSHSYSHLYMTTLTDQEIDDEVRLSKEFFVGSGLNVNNFAVPYGNFDDRVKLAAQKYYRGSRVSLGHYNNKPLETFELKTIWFVNSANIDTRSGFSFNTFEHYKYYIDQAVLNDYWLIISTHSWEIADWGFEALMEQVVEYAKIQSEIVTVNEALERLDNVVESNLFSKKEYYDPHFVISSDGEVESNLSFIKKLPRNSVTPSTLASDFDNFMISACNITNAYAASTGFPEGRGGNLLTYNFASLESPNDFAYSRQEYKLYGLDKIYYRHAKPDGTWGDFYNPTDPSDQLFSVANPNSITGNLLPQDFTMGKKVISRFGASTAGMPFTNSGSIEVDFSVVSGSNWGYGKQIARPYNLTDVYVRSATSATTWSAWVKFTGVTV